MYAYMYMYSILSFQLTVVIGKKDDIQIRVLNPQVYVQILSHFGSSLMGQVLYFRFKL